MGTNRARGKRNWVKSNGRIPTRAKRCTIMVPGVGASALPSPCESRCFKAGRCAEHYRDWRHAREARAIETREKRNGPAPKSPSALSSGGSE